MELKVVPRSGITPISRSARSGEAAHILSHLLDLKKEQALDVGITDRKKAAMLRGYGRVLAKKEGVTIGAGFSSTGSLCLWVELNK